MANEKNVRNNAGGDQKKYPGRVAFWRVNESFLQLQRPAVKKVRSGTNWELVEVL